MNNPSLEHAWSEFNAGNHDAALKMFRALVREDPKNANALHGIGLVAMRSGNYESAVPVLERAINASSDGDDILADYSYCLRRIGKIDQAAETLQLALDKQPGNSRNWCAHGEMLISAGDPAGAQRSFHKAISLDTANIDAYAQLGLLVRDGHYEFSAVEIQAINSLVVDSAQSNRARSILLFTLAYHFDQLKEHDLAFEKFQQANTLRLISAGTNEKFDATAQSAFIDEIENIFTQDFVENSPAGANQSDVPVFIVGMMRSGTSLIEQIISSHSDAAGAGELNHIYSISTQGLAMLSGGEAYPEALRTLRPAALKQMAADYLRLLQQRAPGAGRITDKMPTNFQFLGLIWMMFPNARVIHVSRDPVDTCVSCYCNNLRAGWTCDLEGLGLFYRNYLRLMGHWRRVLPLKMLEVQYETLVANPEAGIRGIIQFCGLPWQDMCLRFHESRGSVQTASKMQVREAMHGKRVARWRRFERHLGPLLEILRSSDNE